MQKNFVHNLKVWKFFRNNVLYKSKRINTPRTKGLNKFPESRRCAMGLNKSSLEIHSCVSKQWLMTSHDHSHNPELEELIVKKGGRGRDVRAELNETFVDGIVFLTLARINERKEIRSNLQLYVGKISFKMVMVM